MAHYGTLRDYHLVDNESAADDIRGSKVYGLKDEKLGKIDDIIFDHSTG
jgi:sporulation protein YlmC with PRC-barrel domain